MRSALGLPDQPSLKGQSRRQALRWIASAVVAIQAPQARGQEAHTPFGPVVPPAPAPPIPLSRDDGIDLTLPAWLRGKVSAVQLIFTSCTATCPLQGALFAAVARRLRDADTQLISLSVDPTRDRPAILRAWLQRFGAPAPWRAAAPREADVAPMFDYFKGRESGVDRHSAAVFLFDPRARLVFRTADMPPAGHVVELLHRIRRTG